MTVFKTFMKVLKKRIHVSMIYIVVFVSICIAATYSSSETESFSNTELSICIYDLDDSQASRAFVDYIGSINKIVDIPNDKDSILDALYYGRVDIVLTVNEGYSDMLSSGNTDGLFSNYRVPGSYVAELFDSQLNRYISMINSCIAGGMDVNQAADEAASLVTDTINVDTVSFSSNSNVEYDTNITYFFQYLAYIVVAVLISGLCPVILVMNQKEIRSRTECSCISSSSRIMQIVLGTVTFVVALYVLFMITAAILFRSMLFNQKGLLAMLNFFVFIIFAMMLTVFISMIAPSHKTVNMIANVFSLGMSFLCGVFVPQSLLSSTVLGIGRFLPAYWYVRANNMLAGLDGAAFSQREFFMCIGMELAFSAAVFCAVMLAVKTKRTAKSL
jgi:ABC-2 type transport system permease protein